ncbi:MAG TPA: carboxylating nicotinate-nucleotide diphosphorylase, partial [Candidatus Acidoferrum sp.]|nr:carboxylating nicotinate-nucleotide diphosphorylase [Candidatus Acidoferrum sp.]
LELTGRRASASVLAREEGVIAGLAEFAMLYGENGVDVALDKTDGDVVETGEVVLRAKGDQAQLLALERTGLNLLQRMSGIATDGRRLQNLVLHTGSTTRIVGTRKTPWGLLDKRALHLAGVGTHRLGLGDAILIKNNHLALVANSEEHAAPKAIEKAWSLREKSAFIEVEVRSEAAAYTAAEAFRRLQDSSGEEFPCVLMLDNMSPDRIASIIKGLQRDSFWDAILVEASGGISESNLGEYAACGADVISIGALTHSARALDLSQRM